MPPDLQHLCWNAATHYPYLATPMFMAQNRFDQCQAGDVFGADPCGNRTMPTHNRGWPSTPVEVVMVLGARRGKPSKFEHTPRAHP